MVEIVTDMPHIGISACAFDCPVRYNGKSLDALKSPVIYRDRRSVSKKDS